MRKRKKNEKKVTVEKKERDFFWFVCVDSQRGELGREREKRAAAVVVVIDNCV